MFNSLHSSKDQELFEKQLCNQSSHYKNTDDFCYEGKQSRATAKSTHLVVSKDEWYTKEDTGKSMIMHCMYCSSMPKGSSQAEVTSNSEKIKPIALAVIALCLSEGISQSVSQSLENSVQ